MFFPFIIPPAGLSDFIFVNVCFSQTQIPFGKETVFPANFLSPKMARFEPWTLGVVCRMFNHCATATNEDHNQVSQKGSLVHKCKAWTEILIV
jgi:hypothetical protein